jgi:hypothetical protein
LNVFDFLETVTSVDTYRKKNHGPGPSDRRRFGTIGFKEERSGRSPNKRIIKKYEEIGQKKKDKVLF